MPSDRPPARSVPRPPPVWDEDDEPDSVPAVRRPRADASAPVEGLVAADRTLVLPAEERLRLNRPLRRRKLVHATRQLLAALACIHARGLVHRDVKPGNVLVAPGGVLKLVDFGLVKVMAAAHITAATGSVVGTYRYMAPEQARGEAVDARTDLYAVGVVLFEMLCGRPPFMDRTTARLLQAVTTQAAPDPRTINPEADPRWSEVVGRLLAKEAGVRPASAAETASLLGLA